MKKKINSAGLGCLNAAHSNERPVFRTGYWLAPGIWVLSVLSIRMLLHVWDFGSGCTSTSRQFMLIIYLWWTPVFSPVGLEHEKLKLQTLQACDWPPIKILRWAVWLATIHMCCHTCCWVNEAYPMWLHKRGHLKIAHGFLQSSFLHAFSPCWFYFVSFCCNQL